MQSLLEEFNADDFVWEYKTDDDNHVTHLFFASHHSLSMFSSVPEVLILDCTYKTNRFDLPLFNMVGRTNINTSFFVAFSFIKSEAEEDYRWVLEQLLSHLLSAPGIFVTDCDQALSNALSVIFPGVPHLLRHQHIRRNVLSRCKRVFSTRRRSERLNSEPATADDEVNNVMQAWDRVSFAATVPAFQEEWRSFQRRYRREAAFLDYLRDTWLPVKEKLMAAWVDEVLHLGTTTMSRAESAHAVLKRYLQVSGTFATIASVC
jgi:hypothetical protein